MLIRQWGGAEMMKEKEEEVIFLEYLLYFRQLSNRAFTYIISFNSHRSLAKELLSFPFTDEETDCCKVYLDRRSHR